MIHTLGKTKSGKKVYFGFYNENHKEFTKEDHLNAASLCERMREGLLEEARCLDSEKEQDENYYNARLLYKQSILHEEEYYNL